MKQTDHDQAERDRRKRRNRVHIPLVLAMVGFYGLATWVITPLLDQVEMLEPSTSKESSEAKLARAIEIAKPHCMVRFSDAARYDHDFERITANYRAGDPPKILVHVVGTMENGFGASQKVTGECFANAETGEIESFDLF